MTSSSQIPRVRLPSGDILPALGWGTWGMGERAANRAAEVAALQWGLAAGFPVIDTAEMYAEGGAEEVVGEALAGRREQAFLVSKVYPHNASRTGVVAACERSLRRLRTDYLDLYLLHWRGRIPLSETIAGFQQLQSAGKIRHWGVSNFDCPDLDELSSLPGGQHCAANQVLYNLSRRGIEWQLLPTCQQGGLLLMAYSPLEQARLLKHARLEKFARERGATASQIAVAWLLRQPQVMAIPKSHQISHLQELTGAFSVQLTPQDLQELERIFPPPQGPQALEML